MVLLSRDLGFEMKPVLAIDAKATEHILHTQGIGRLTHIDVAYLWMQDEVRPKRSRVRRVNSEGKRGRSRHHTAQQSGDGETLPHAGISQRGGRK